MCCAVLGHSVVSESLWPHELEHSRFLCPWRFSRQEYWSGLSCPLPGDLPIPGISLWSPALRADSSQFEPPGKPRICTNYQELFCLWSQIQNVCQTSFLGSPLRLWEGLYSKKYFLVWFLFFWWLFMALMMKMKYSLEKERATYSSVPAWRIPGMGKPGGLSSMGSHRVGHDWSDLALSIVTLGWLITSTAARDSWAVAVPSSRWQEWGCRPSAPGRPPMLAQAFPGPTSQPLQ